MLSSHVIFSAQTVLKLSKKIEKSNATVAVIGLGYVGLPLALEIARVGFKVIGVDIDQGKIRALRAGKSYLIDVGNSRLAQALRDDRFSVTGSFSALRRADVIVICVPTPLNKSRDPDISFVLDATEQIRKNLRRDQLVILESTTYPGTTEELILPELERSGLQVGKHFFLAFSPERIDPGNKLFSTRNTPKIVSGVTERCTEMARLFYSHVVEKVIPVSSPKCAETVKLLENTFRSVNIAMVNEMALICERLGLDIYEVIDAAATKPFGFIPFYPGPGIGGHCIPVDPHYLAWKLKALNLPARFISLATEINGTMPSVVVSLVARGLNRQGKSIRGSAIVVLGVTYKKDVPDCRESPALDVIQMLCAEGANLFYHDPLVAKLDIGNLSFQSIRITPAFLQKQDCVVILTDHSAYDFRKLLQKAKLIVDTRNATKDLAGLKDRIVKLGSGAPRT